jgi:uncharacterized protein YjbI with pentapeptide repeats
MRLARFATASLTLSGMSLALICAAGCVSDSGDPDPAVFRYQAATGACRNGAGAAGYNAPSEAKLRASHNAECTDLSGLDLSLLARDSTKFTFDSLKSWNFKGALFKDARLHFNHIIDSKLQGADLSEIDYGYATITGETDAYTRPPMIGCKGPGPKLDCEH